MAAGGGWGRARGFGEVGKKAYGGSKLIKSHRCSSFIPRSIPSVLNARFRINFMR